MKAWDGTRHWSLSEFLNLLDVRGLCWGKVEIGAEHGFRVRANETVMFYVVLEGDCTVRDDNVVELRALVEKSRGYGASALLTRAAAL
ncbi:MAG: hypothetical protein QM676_02535, partial [Novosphingobium sp.]